jgi:hypothetical protein
MVLEDPLWQDDNTTPARLDRQFIEDVFDVEGVIKPSTGALLVAPRAAGANMSVDVAAGRAVIKGDDEANQGSYRVISTATENLPIGARPGSDSRIDLVVARVRDAAVTGGVSSDWILEVIPGTVAAAPVVPAVPATAIPLAEITVTSATLSITATEITKDRRSAAQNAAYVAKAGSTMAGLLTLDAGLASTLMRAITVSVPTGESTTSTTYVGLATVGPDVVFTVPPSGQVLAVYTAQMENASPGSCFAAPELFREGVGSVDPASDSPAAVGVGAGFRTQVGFRIWTELVVGAAYRARLAYRSSGGTATFMHRRLVVLPLT